MALEAVKLMAAVCLVPPDGHDATLAAITDAGEIKDLERFQPIAQGKLRFKCSDKENYSIMYLCSEVHLLNRIYFISRIANL